ncbi:hypothetical protein ACHAXA_009838 [Cyclostephanos tholiformis]|uniref:Uncharacterized protein n=1 Tax=Cyclostephanos tholiformis TaxID=382380 RepID=A0ABD3R6V4_9STRA
MSSRGGGGAANDNAKRRRAYIGNLRYRPDLPARLHTDLFVPHRLDVINYPPAHHGATAATPGGGGSTGGISIVYRARNDNAGGFCGGGGGKRSNAHALVEFRDVDYAVRILDGVVFDGRTLRVCRERTVGGGGSNNIGGGIGRGGGGFGSGRWAGKGDDDRRGLDRRRDHPPTAPTFRDVAEEAASRPNDVLIGLEDDGDFLDEEATIVDRIRRAVATEFDEGGGSDVTSTAIACTSAVTLVLSSMEALGLGVAGEDDVDDDGGGDGSTSSDGGGSLTNGDFHTRLRLPLSDLLREYGERDVDWMNDRPRRRQRQQKRQYSSTDELREDAKVETKDDYSTGDDYQSRLRMPLSKLLAEYGEQDDDWNKEGGRMHSSTNRGCASGGKHQTTIIDAKNGPPSRISRVKRDEATAGQGMLAHHGKASVHLELESFGYKYGAPPHARNGFTYTRPLPPLDIRDLDRALGHVSKFNGLSYLVRRSLLNPSRRDDDHDDNKEEDGVDGGDAAMKTTTKEDERSPMRRRADEIADEIVKVLVESIDEGGHGPVSPLTMTISIGSEYGRHRSVVLVEHLAVVLRARLRRNDGSRYDGVVDHSGIVRQPVSVGTRHRDLDARHQDEEAFGEDLKRDARKAAKAKTRQMRSSGWDDDGW